MQSGDIKKIKGLTEGAAELLSAVGVEDLGALAESEVDGLHEEMVQANGHLGISKKAPTKKQTTEWINTARGLRGEKPVQKAASPQKKVISARSLPIAKPVDKSYILKEEIAVNDVPIMTDFLNEQELESGGGSKQEPKPKPKAKPKVFPKSNVAIRESAPSTLPAKKEAPIQGLSDEDRKMRPPVKPLKSNKGFDIRKTASPELNAGKKLHSRTYVRGVLNPQPGRVKWGAIFTLITVTLFLASFILGCLVILSQGVPITLSIWLVGIPVAFLFFGFIYLVQAKPMKCRICGQPLFSPKSCRRHMKAHRLRFLGYIIPTALHMVLFHWFRCIFCGTAVRLKE